MDETAYLASLRLSAWMGKQGTYTSDVKEAREFPLGEAIAMARRHKDARGMNLVPVRKSDVEAL